MKVPFFVAAPQPARQRATGTTRHLLSGLGDLFDEGGSRLVAEPFSLRSKHSPVPFGDDFGPAVYNFDGGLVVDGVGRDWYPARALFNLVHGGVVKALAIQVHA